MPLAGDHLIHDAAVAADELVLRLLAVEGDFRLADGQPWASLKAWPMATSREAEEERPVPWGTLPETNQIEAAQGVAPCLADVSPRRGCSRSSAGWGWCSMG